ncbi:delta-12 fatty acid desaturase protein [Rickenella mellea]|uniref:Delta-12 fatty acid desaturase protein n=1 Tax=Rickenella mellea TaxID=50990 RepID=A0A4Y7PK14_9AGAM|nr:delta-12 fatty acid desaturase protein [Rickenella mellea]
MTQAKGVTTVAQGKYVVPDVSTKDVLSAIPAHCYKRSAFRSSLYVLWDFCLWAIIYQFADAANSAIDPNFLDLPHPFLYSLARFSIWSLYGFAAGLVATGLWVIAHECGHQSFSEYPFLNHTVGWVLHSGLGVPYHSWRITHTKHHAFHGHMTEDQHFVPRTRSEVGLPPLDPAKEDAFGSSVSEDVKKELWEALGDSPIAAALRSATYVLGGWPLYLTMNLSGQTRYPVGTNHFTRNAVLFAPRHYNQVLISNFGILMWLSLLAAWTYTRGFAEVFCIYLVPYLWVNHWVVLIVFLQHTDPVIPHYRAPEFTFIRGAFCTMDRNILGDLGSIIAWIGATCTHGISENHATHHISSKIPHYNAWEATEALRSRFPDYMLQGPPVGWAELYRVFRECKFVEDQGSVIFYKNAYGLAQMRPVLPDSALSDSGVEVDK